MKAGRHAVWLLFFGALWGMNEVVAGGIYYSEDRAQGSLWLVAFALFVLASARAVLPYPGTSTALGAVVALFKLVNGDPFFCHLLGIFCMGLAFDLVATLVLKEGRARIPRIFRAGLAGLFSVYLGHGLFALLITYVFRYEFWVSEGISKVLHHAFVAGSLAGLAAACSGVLGFEAGRKVKDYAVLRPQWIYAGAVVASMILWALGSIPN